MTVTTTTELNTEPPKLPTSVYTSEAVKRKCEQNHLDALFKLSSKKLTFQIISPYYMPKMQTEVPPTPNPSNIDSLDYHRIKTPKLTGKLRNTQWNHGVSYGENDKDVADWLSIERERTTVIRSVPKLKIHEEEFPESPRGPILNQNLTQYEKMLNEISRPYPQFKLVYPRHMLTNIRKVTGMNNFIVQPNAVAPTPEERYNITRELIVKSAAPKVDSGYVAHVSHRPEWNDRHFEQVIEGCVVRTGPEPPLQHDSNNNDDLQRSQTVPMNEDAGMLLEDYDDLDLGNLNSEILYSKEFLEGLNSPLQRNLLRMKERDARERYAFKSKDCQRVRTTEYLHKQLTRTNYITSSLSVLMAAGEQTTFERDLTWKTARKIDILRNKSRSTPLVPYGILYPRIGGLTRFQGRPTRGEISLIENRVENMSKSFVDNREHLKTWKNIDNLPPEHDNKSEEAHTSAVFSGFNEAITPQQRRQLAQEEAKINRMKSSFQKLPNIDKRAAELLARTIAEEERRENNLSQNNFDLNNEQKSEPRRGKAATGTLYKSNLAPRSKTKDPFMGGSTQFGLGKAVKDGEVSHEKKPPMRKPPRMKPVFPAKEKTSASFDSNPLSSFDPHPPPTTPNVKDKTFDSGISVVEGREKTQDESLNKTFITQPQDTNSSTKEAVRATSSKSVRFETDKLTEEEEPKEDTKPSHPLSDGPTEEISEAAEDDQATNGSPHTGEDTTQSAQTAENSLENKTDNPEETIDNAPNSDNKETQSSTDPVASLEDINLKPEDSADGEENQEKKVIDASEQNTDRNSLETERESVVE